MVSTVLSYIYHRKIITYSTITSLYRCMNTLLRARDRPTLLAMPAPCPGQRTRREAVCGCQPNVRCASFREISRHFAATRSILLFIAVLPLPWQSLSQACSDRMLTMSCMLPLVPTKEEYDKPLEIWANHPVRIRLQ